MPRKRDGGWGPTGPVALSLAGRSDRCSPASTSSSKRRDSVSLQSLQGHRKLQAKQCPPPPAESIFA